jgi:hypothetical protein
MRAVPTSVTTSEPTSASTSELSAPGVAFEACHTFDADLTEPGICTRCGWLDDEHVAPAIAA